MTGGVDRTSPVRSVLVVGDGVGVPRLLRHLEKRLLAGIVAAEIRPQYVAALSRTAADLKIPFLIQPRAGSVAYGEFVRTVRRLAPDLILCDSYSMLLRADVLAVPTAGAINLHGGVLPEYRGSNPIQWAIINGEREAGVTMHYMDQGFDSGDVIASRHVPLLFTDTWQDVLERIGDETESLLDEQLPLIVSGRAAATPQDPSRARHYLRRNPEDSRIDWARSVRDIYNLVRASVSPLPGASYVLEGEKRVVSTYQTVSEIAALKQRVLGPHWPVSNTGLMTIEGKPSVDALRFVLLDSNGKPQGIAELASIDYDNNTCVGRVSLQSGIAERILDFLAEFARSELQVTKLVRGSA